MKKNSRILTFLMIFLISLPLFYLASVYTSLPEIIPMHFNSKLEADRMGRRSEIWIPVGVLAGAALLAFLAMQNIHRIDPKRKNAPNTSSFNKMGAGLAIFITALNFLIIASAFKGAAAFNSFLFPLLGLMFAFLGNNMNNIKPNYFAGIRLPWTLSDDNNWRKTHHFAGKLWFWAGITLAVISLFIPGKIILPFLLTITIAISIIPAIYSWRLFKNKPPVS